MGRFFGSYSVRPGYHGARKPPPRSEGLDVWTCPQGHINPCFKLIDERATGGFVRRVRVTECSRCGFRLTPVAADAEQQQTSGHDESRAAEPC